MNVFNVKVDTDAKVNPNENLDFRPQMIRLGHSAPALDVCYFQNRSISPSVRRLRLSTLPSFESQSPSTEQSSGRRQFCSLTSSPSPDLVVIGENVPCDGAIVITPRSDDAQVRDWDDLESVSLQDTPTADPKLIQFHGNTFHGTDVIHLKNKTLSSTHHGLVVRPMACSNPQKMQKNFSRKCYVSTESSNPFSEFSTHENTTATGGSDGVNRTTPATWRPRGRVLSGRSVSTCNSPAPSQSPSVWGLCPLPTLSNNIVHPTITFANLESYGFASASKNDECSVGEHDELIPDRNFTPIIDTQISDNAGLVILRRHTCPDILISPVIEQQNHVVVMDSSQFDGLQQQSVILTSPESTFGRLTIKSAQNTASVSPSQSSDIQSLTQQSPRRDKHEKGVVLSAIQSIVDLAQQSINSISESAKPEDHGVSVSSKTSPTDGIEAKNDQKPASKKGPAKVTIVKKPTKSSANKTEGAKTTELVEKKKDAKPASSGAISKRTGNEAEAALPTSRSSAPAVQIIQNAQPAAHNAQHHEQEGSCSNIVKGLCAVVGGLVVTGSTVLVSILASKAEK
ncbi:MAG: hypothetical protein LBR91_01945 [Puniceicoccales bacterium]|jgi:hypothetical protein|nr:hypothetical protein [Puniceicoccales bacterium]